MGKIIWGTKIKALLQEFKCLKEEKIRGTGWKKENFSMEQLDFFWKYNVRNQYVEIADMNDKVYI